MITRIRSGSRQVSPVLTGTLPLFGDFLNHRAGEWKQIFILVDENTREHCLPLLLSNVSGLQFAEILEIPAGEASKSIDVAAMLWNQLSARTADRHSLLVCLGGGVVTDLGGFVAATFKRGIPFIHLPTTLLGMVDAAIGGKTGINLKTVKNQLGTFSLPEAVFIDPIFLASLPQREIVSGMGEIIKSALTGDPVLWKKIRNLVEKGFPANVVPDTFWLPLIRACIRVKARVVNRDFKETGERRILNFGHTIGHALESWSLRHDTVPISHGEAVAAGMICEGYLSVKRTGFPHDDFIAMEALVEKVFGRFPVPQSRYPVLRTILLQDKKNRDGHLKPVLLSGIGRPRIDCDCNWDDVREAIDYYSQRKTGG